MDLKLGGAQRNCKRQKIELDFISSSPTDSFCAGLDHFPPRGEGADILWGLRSSKDRQKERSLCPFAFGAGRNMPQEFWIVLPHLGCQGEMPEWKRKIKANFFLFFFVFSHSEA